MATHAAGRALPKKVAAAKANAILAEESSEDEWVVVSPRKNAEAPPPASLHRTVLNAELLDLKKKVWILRIARRKTASKVVAELYGQGLDESLVEAYCGQMEAVRDALGLQWTFFEQELLKGTHDDKILGGSFDNVMAAAVEDAAKGGANGSWPVSVKMKPVGKQSKRTPPCSPQSGPRPSPKLTPKVRDMPPQEVWLAAKAHHKSNFFAPAVLPEHGAANCGLRMLALVVAHCEVRDALGLALASRSFMRVLLLAESESIRSMWGQLASIGFADRSASPSSAVFAKDRGFRCATWARYRSFTVRCVRGIASPVEVVAAQNVGCGGGLGVFLGEDCPQALTFGDGRQNFGIIDVAKRHAEEADIDRFKKCILRSSLGVHPEEVTASWPIGGNSQLWCIAARGVVAARPIPSRGILPKEAVPAFQWLELPNFDSGLLPTVAKNADAGPTSSKSSSKTASPAPSPVLKAAASPLLRAVSPSAKAAASPGLKPASSPGLRPQTPKFRPAFDPPPREGGGGEGDTLLARHSVPQDEVAQASMGGAVTAAVEAVWTLPRDNVLLLVREDAASTVSAPACGNTSGRRWLHVWKLPDDGGFDLCAPLEPIVSAAVSSAVSVVDSLAGADCNKCWILCGLESGGAELRHLDARKPGFVLEEKPLRSTFTLVQSWPAHPSSSSRVSHVLLRPTSSEHCKPMSVAAQVCHVVAHGPWGTATLLPVQGFEKSAVVALRRVGSASFAACTNSHALAFEVVAESAPVLSAVVSLPACVEHPLQPDDPVVASFDATPYCFYAVMDKQYVKNSKTNALCCLWPGSASMEGVPKVDGEPGVRKSHRSAAPSIPAAALTLMGAAAQQDDDDEELEPEVNCAGAVHLRAWLSQEGLQPSEWAPTCAVAIVLNQLLLRAHRSPPIHDLVLEPSRGSMLAISAIGTGIFAYDWGVEVSPVLAQTRERLRRQRAEEAEEQRLEGCRRRLQRLHQRLTEMDKLEEKRKEQGEEALSEDQRLKLQRRAQVEAEAEQLQIELGWDLDEPDAGVAPGEDGDAERQRALEAMQKRKEKEKTKCMQVETKKMRQKDRERNREQKFGYEE